MKISKEFILSGKTKNGGWTKEQLALIGVNWPPEKGWMKRIEGKEITNSQASKFQRLPARGRIVTG